MKKSILVFVVSVFGLVFMATVTARVLGFPDVSEDQWYYKYVMQIKDWNVVNGNDDGTFKPSANINRAEFSKMIVQYDKRVDKKISEAIENIPVPKIENPPEPVLSETKNLPSIMHFDRDDSETPNLCPEGWKEVAYGRIYENTRSLNRRTCLTQKNCKSLVLRDRDKTPALCPAGWTEGDFGRGKQKENQRVCYICE